jgi:hypothetical protein
MSTDDLLELEWYFGGGAEADLGARSIQGGFEATMQRLSLGGSRQDAHEQWVEGKPVWVAAQQSAHETRSTYAASDDALERLHNRRGKLADARRIFARVRKLSRRDRAVLELQFGDASRLCGVSIALLCHVESVQQAVATVNSRRARKHRPPLGPREALEALATSTIAADAALVVELVRSARIMLTSALEAYYARSRG